MRIILILLILGQCSIKNEQSEWETIFNGKNLDGWTVKVKGYPSGDNFGNTFKVVDEAIQVSYENYNNFDFKFGHIYYTCLLYTSDAADE